MATDHDTDGEPSVVSPLLPPSPAAAVSSNDATPIVIASHGGTGGTGGGGGDDPSVPLVGTSPSSSSENRTIFTGGLVIVVFLISLNESFIENVSWPFLPFMVRGYGYDEQDLGFYVGILASSYFVAQLFSSFLWGRLADRIGRRPTILAGCMGATISIVIFGFSSSFTMAICSRIFSGLMNGNLAIVKAYLSEVSDTSNRVRGFAALTLGWSAGNTFGPMVGGFLSHPDSYKWFPSSWHLFVTYPFALPCIVTAMVGILAILPGLFALPETPQFLAWRARRDALEANGGVQPIVIDASNDANADPIHRALFHPDAPTPSMLEILSVNDVMVTTTCYGAACLIWSFFDETFALVCQTPTVLGGFGMTATQIGIALAIAGAAIIFTQLVIFEKQNHHLGSVTVYQIGLWLSIILFLIFPLLSIIKADDTRATFWSLMTIVMALRGYIGGTMYLAIILCVNNSIPSHLAGTVNGVGQAFAALGRTIGPVTGGVLWSLSLDLIAFPLHAWILYITMAIFAFLAYLWSRRLPSHLTQAWSERVKVE